MPAPRPVRKAHSAKTRRFGKRSSPAVLHSALLALLLSVFLLAAAQVRAYAGDVTTRSFTLQGIIPTPVRVFSPPANQRLPVQAVIAHGYAANKELMSAFAIDLAKQGITVYTFDFPGHGASTAYYGGSNQSSPVKGLITTLSEVIDYAQERQPAPNSRLVLLGYSLGTIPVGEYALQHPDMANLQATVLVAGILSDHPTTTTPRNLLVLSGQFDLPGINDTARKLIASACAIPTSHVTGTSYQCESETANLRQRVILPGLDHISIVTAASTHNTVLRWLHNTVNQRIGSMPVNADVRLHWMLIGFAAALLALLPLLKLGSLAFRLQPAHQADNTSAEGDIARRGLRPWWALGALAGALGMALMALRLILPNDFFAPDPFPFMFLNQQVSADVAIFFLLAGVMLLAGLRFIPHLRQRIPLRLTREVVPQILIAFGATMFLSLTLGSLSTYAWESLALEPQRLWRGAVYALMVWPFFFGLRTVLSAAAVRMKRPVLADAGAVVLILTALVGSILFNFSRLSYLGILLPIVAIMLVILMGYAAWGRRVSSQPTAMIATLETLLLAWILSATLPLVG